MFNLINQSMLIIISIWIAIFVVHAQEPSPEIDGMVYSTLDVFESTSYEPSDTHIYDSTTTRTTYRTVVRTVPPPVANTPTPMMQGIAIPPGGVMKLDFGFFQPPVIPPKSQAVSTNPPSKAPLPNTTAHPKMQGVVIPPGGEAKLDFGFFQPPIIPPKPQAVASDNTVEIPSVPLATSAPIPKETVHPYMQGVVIPAGGQAKLDSGFFQPPIVPPTPQAAPSDTTPTVTSRSLPLASTTLPVSKNTAPPVMPRPTIARPTIQGFNMARGGAVKVDFSVEPPFVPSKDQICTVSTDLSSVPDLTSQASSIVPDVLDTNTQITDSSIMAIKTQMDQTRSKTQTPELLNLKDASQTLGGRLPVPAELPIETATPTTGNNQTPEIDNINTHWISRLQSPIAGLVVRSSFLYGFYAVVSVSVIYVLFLIISIPVKRMVTCVKSFFPRRNNDLAPVGFQESAGVSTTGSSSLDSPRPELQEQGERTVNWAKTTARERAGHSSSSRSGSSAPGTIRRSRAPASERQLPRDMV